MKYLTVKRKRSQHTEVMTEAQWLDIPPHYRIAYTIVSEEVVQTETPKVVKEIIEKENKKAGA